MSAGSTLVLRFPAGRIITAGHRVVHGRTGFECPVVIDNPARALLEQRVSLAPLHQTHNLEAVDAVRAWNVDRPTSLS